MCEALGVCHACAALNAQLEDIAEAALCKKVRQRGNGTRLLYTQALEAVLRLHQSHQRLDTEVGAQRTSSR